jgi:hypothetical protein
MSKLNWYLNAARATLFSSTLLFCFKTYSVQEKTVDPDVFNEIMTICHNEAKEDSVENEELLEYLVGCIATELDINSHQEWTKQEIVKLYEKWNSETKPSKQVDYEFFEQEL